MGIDIIVALVAGFVSFISPCVLPLVPAYIGYMGGRVTHTVSTRIQPDGSAVATQGFSERFSTFLHGLAFVGGFTLIFVALGLISTAFISTFGSTAAFEQTLGRVGGILIIFFGLHFMGALSWLFAKLRQREGLLENPLFSAGVALLLVGLISWGFTGTLTLWDVDSYPRWNGLIALVLIAGLLMLMVIKGAFIEPAAFWESTFERLEGMLYADTRREMDASRNQGLLGSGFMGVVFAAGWSPCIGPTLGVALTLAANSPTGAELGRSAALMTAYSLGLGIPFLITALMLDSAQGGLRRLNRQMATIKLVSGVFLVFIGYTIASGELQRLSLELSGEFADFSYNVEQCIVGTVEGELRTGQLWSCLNEDPDYRTLIGINEGSIDPDTLEPLEESAATNTEASSESAALPDAEAIPVGLAIGNRAPDFSASTVSGEPVSLADYRGQVVLLNFWYTTCGPCRREMPEFERAFAQYGSDGDFVILAINREESPEEITRFAQDLGGLSFPLLLDEEGAIQYQYNVLSYPTTFLLDKNGVIVFRNFGAITSEQIEELTQTHAT